MTVNYPKWKTQLLILKESTWHSCIYYIYIYISNIWLYRYENMRDLENNYDPITTDNDVVLEYRRGIVPMSKIFPEEPLEKKYDKCI